MIEQFCSWFMIGAEEIPALIGLVVFLLALGVPNALPKKK